MLKKLGVVTVHVKDIDEALDFYMNKLGLHKIMDVTLKPGARWVTVATGPDDVQIFLKDPRGWYEPSRAENVMKTVGQATTWVFFTDDCFQTYGELRARGVHFRSEPKSTSYGIEAVFEDLYGNVFSLNQLA